MAALVFALAMSAFLPLSGRESAFAAVTATEPAKADTKADNKTEDKTAPRLSIENDKYWINGEGIVRVRLLGRTGTEDVKVELSKTGYGKIENKSWEGEYLLVKLKSSKTKAVTLTATFGEEKATAKIEFNKGKKKKAEDVYTYIYDSMVEIKTWDSKGNVYIGSGFFVGDGQVLTNYHVVDSASKIVIRDYYGVKYQINKILNYSEKDDLILFDVESGNRTALSFCKSVSGGERVYCMGSPLGLAASFVAGMVSNPKLTVDELNCVQVSLPSGTGIGGAPIVNVKGQVIGVMCLTVPSAQNMCFAIDYKTVTDFLNHYTDANGMEMNKFFEEHKGMYKESNNYWEGVVTDNLANSGTYSSEELDSTEIYDNAYHAMVEIICIYGKYGEEGYSTGTGFFISPDTIVTNWHVIDNFTYLYIYDYDQRVYELNSVPRYNEKADIATFKVTSEEGLYKHTCLEVENGYIPRVGETIYTFGNPARYNATFCEGTVMMSRFVMDGYNHIAFSAPITEGSSGGALINRYGRVIGVTGIKLNEIENVGLAIRINYLGEL